MYLTSVLRGAAWCGGFLPARFLTQVVRIPLTTTNVSIGFLCPELRRDVVVCTTVSIDEDFHFGGEL